MSAVIALTRRLAAQSEITVTAEWLDQLFLNVANLLQTLDESDSPSLPPSGAMTHHGRLQSLEENLQRLETDFQLVAMALKVVVVQANRDRPDLVRLLLRKQIAFASRMMTVRLRMARHRWMSFS